MELLRQFWYFICFVFGFQSLDTLVKDSHEIIYEKSSQTEPVQLLVCVELTDLYPNKTTIDLKELRDALHERFNSSMKSDWERHKRVGFEKLVLNRTKSGDYLIFDGRACLSANDEGELKYIEGSLSLAEACFAIKRDTFDFVRMGSAYYEIDQLTVQRKEHPYSDCDQSNSQFFCLNKCFKRRFRLARYYYGENETGLIYLNWNHRNRSIEESERDCFRKCKMENCKMIQLIPTGVLGVGVRKNHKNTTLKAQPKLNEFDYWIQLIGLVCSFAGFCIHEFISIAIEFAALKVKRKKLRIALFGLKLVILILGLVSFAYLGTRTVLDYKEKEKSSTEKEITRNLAQPKNLHLAICVEIGEYVSHSYENKTMSEIERATNEALNDAVYGIYVGNHNRSAWTPCQFHPKVLFRRFISRYYRCFLLTFHPNYQMIPSNPKMAIKLKKNNHPYNPELFLLAENENLSHKSFKYSVVSSFMKKISMRLKSAGRCVNYEEQYGDCRSRCNCVERCIALEYMKKFTKITFGTKFYPLVVDKDWFSPAEWNAFHPLKITNDNIGAYESIRSECLKKIPDEKPCLEIKFEQTFQVNPSDIDAMEIDLQFDLMQSIEESPSKYKLYLDLVSIQSIFFGLTVLGLLKMACSCIQTRLKENKFVLCLIYLLCLAGGIWHTYHIFHLVVSRELVPTLYYKIEKEIQIPEIVFCIKIDKEVDSNHKLTGTYLEKLTRELTAERLFENMAYLNEFGEWTTFDLKRVKRFFYLDMKCFRINLDQVYHRNRFHFLPENQVLKVNFSRIQNEEEENVYFLTKSTGSLTFSKIVYLLNSFEYSIVQETSLYEYEDRFSFIRKHFLSFQEDVSDLQEQLFDLQGNKHNLKTLNLPMEENKFGQEVDEDLFEQLYCSSIQKNRNKRIKSNHRQRFTDNYFKKIKNSGSDFGFTLNFLKKIVFSTNEENIGGLILSLLNVLSIWLDLAVLDLHPLFIYLSLCFPVYLFSKINQILLFISKWLKEFRLLLYEMFKTQK